MTEHRHRPSAKWVAIFLVGLALFLALAIFNHVRGFDLWRNYALSGFFLGAPVTYVLWRMDVRVPHYIQGIVILALLAHYVGGSLGSPGPHGTPGLLGMHGINGAYHVFHWWDNLTHGLGIGATCMGFAYLFDAYQLRRGLGWSGTFVGIAAALGALTVGVGVELYEYFGKAVFQTIDQGGYANTAMDLWYNLLGAAGGATIAMTINRTALEQRIRQHWTLPEHPADDRPWYRSMPPRMTSLLVFITIPAVTVLGASIHSLTVDIQAEDVHLYDPLLQVLLLSAVVAVSSIPISNAVHQALKDRRKRRSQE